jgi:hypothetical protein
MAATFTAPQPLLGIQFTTEDGASNTDYVLTRGLEVVTVIGYKTLGAGGAGDALTVRDQTSAADISNVISLNVADTTVIAATTINDATGRMPAGDIMRFVVAAGAGNNGCAIVVKCFPWSA